METPMKTTYLFSAMLAVALMAGCKTSANAPAAPLEGTEWTLIELNGQPLTTVQNLLVPTLKLDAATKRASGTSGINRFGGSYGLTGANLKFGTLVGTRMGGPPEAMSRESAFLETMRQVSSWRITGKTLELKNGDTILLKFTAL
jgi:heat shock protein HslJ